MRGAGRLQAELLHRETKGSPSPEGLGLGGSGLTRAAVIPGWNNGSAEAQDPLGFKHHLLLLFAVLSVFKSVLLAKQGDKKTQVSKQD